MIKLKNCYNCHQLNHWIENCSKILKLINNDLIHFNERRKVCFDKEEQRDAKMRLMYDLFKAKTVRVWLQQQLKMQNTAMKMNVINIIKKLFKFKNEIIDEEKIHDKNILMKVRAVYQEIDFFRRIFFWKFFLKQSAHVLKSKEKKVHLSIIKNVRNENYLNAMTFAKQTILIHDIKMTEMIAKINFKSRATKY